MWRVPHSKNRPYDYCDEEKNDDDGDELEKRCQRIVRLASHFLMLIRCGILAALHPAPRNRPTRTAPHRQHRPQPPASPSTCTMRRRALQIVPKLRRRSTFILSSITLNQPASTGGNKTRQLKLNGAPTNAIFLRRSSNVCGLSLNPFCPC